MRRDNKSFNKMKPISWVGETKGIIWLEGFDGPWLGPKMFKPSTILRRSA